MTLHDLRVEKYGVWELIIEISRSTSTLHKPIGSLQHVKNFALSSPKIVLYRYFQTLAERINADSKSWNSLKIIVYVRTFCAV